MSKSAVDEATDGVRQTLCELIEAAAQEVEACDRYEPNAEGDMDGDRRGSWIDRDDVLFRIRRLAE